MISAKIFVLAFIVLGVFTTGTVSEDLTRENEAQPVCQQQIIINQLEEPLYHGAACNYSTIKEIFSDELQNTTDQLVQLEKTVNSKVDAVSKELIHIKEYVRELAELLKNVTVTPPTPPKDCSEAFANGVSTSGVYTVHPVDHECPIKVYCDMETDGGGWTVFQRRQDGSVNFYRDWEGYRQGFGDLNGEFWLGNDNLHRLTAQGAYRLRVDLEDFEGNTTYAVFDAFRTADRNDNYRLTVEGYSGTAGDSLSGHSNYPFSTKDRDNDSYFSNCAVLFTGGWWYNDCHSANLNGKYLGGQTDVFAKGITWRHWKGHYYSLKYTEMKIKATTN